MLDTNSKEYNTLQTRLSELSLQDYNGYKKRESAEALNLLREESVSRITVIQTEIAELDKEYKVLLSDRGNDTSRRIAIHDRKSILSAELEKLEDAVRPESNTLLCLSREVYARTEEFQNSFREQREIKNKMWS